MIDPFLDSIRDPRSGAISPRQLGERLHISIQDVAKLAKVHRNTVVRSPDSPLVQARLGEVARIIALAASLVEGDLGRAILWFRHQPLAGFAGETAADLTVAGHAEAVIAHLQTLSDGGYA